ncbi:MAG: hypothetical protein QOE90_3231 [Thermoplasmata archaeon]|jgi:hypothetical protein|nr:hypothetical protein [Thermoplasmata archaeon]
MRRSFGTRCVLAALALSLTPFLGLAAAAPANDAGTGGDAPETAEAPLNLTFGNDSGALDPAHGDAQDWYQVFPHPGMALRVEFQTHADFVLAFYDSDGAYLGESPRTTVESQTGAIRLGVFSPGGEAGSYAFSAAELAVPDLRVVSLDVSAPTGTTATEVRNVTLVVDNHGTAAAAQARLDVYVSAKVSNGYRDLFSSAFALGVGETRTFTIPWDSTGEVGGSTLWARIGDDLDTSDDALSLDVDHVVAAPVGVDLLNANALLVSTSYGGGGAGAYAYLVAGSTYVHRGQGATTAGAGTLAAYEWLTLRDDTSGSLDGGSAAPLVWYQMGHVDRSSDGRVTGWAWFAEYPVGGGFHSFDTGGVSEGHDRIGPTDGYSALGARGSDAWNCASGVAIFTCEDVSVATGDATGASIYHNTGWTQESASLTRDEAGAVHAGSCVGSFVRGIGSCVGV